MGFLTGVGEVFTLLYVMIPSHVILHIFIPIWTFLIYGILDNLLYESQQS